AHRPAPQLIVLGIQQLQENRAFGLRGFHPAAVQITTEQLVKLTHAAPATPAQLLQQDFVFGLHGSELKPLSRLRERGWGEGRLWRNSRPALRVEQGQLKKLPSSAPAGHLLPQAGEGKSLASARASAPPLYARRAIISFLISAIASA